MTVPPDVLFTSFAFPNSATGAVNRTMPDRLKDIYNVADFIAGSSASQVRQGIQAAVDAAISGWGGIIFFPPGRYVIDQAIVVGSGGAGTLNGLRFVGCGANVTGGQKGSTIVGDFTSSPDYLIRTGPSSFISSFEYLGFQQTGVFTVNNTNPKGADDISAWSSAMTYNAVSPAPYAQVYYTDGQYYENLQAGNLNHIPSAGAPWWALTGINRNAQIGGGCVYSDSQRNRFIGCDLQVTSGIGIFCTQNNNHIESTGISSNTPASFADRFKSFGVMFSHGVVEDARIYSIGVGVCGIAAGYNVTVNRMIFENVGTAVLGGVTPLNFYDGNTHRYATSGNAGGSLYINNCSIESGWRGFEAGAGITTIENSVAAALDPTQLMDYGFVAGQYMHIKGCSTTGHFTGSAMNLSGITQCDLEGCSANCNPGDTPFVYPNMSGQTGFLRVTTSYSSQSASNIFDGALLFANLPTPSLFLRGIRMRCSNASATTIGSVLAGGGSNNVEISWNGTNWIIVGP